MPTGKGVLKTAASHTGVGDTGANSTGTPRAADSHGSFATS